MTRREIWRLPIFLAIACAIGLGAGVAADGIWDVISWIALALPPLVVAWRFVQSRG
jgi:hypothetical protein